MSRLLGIVLGLSALIALAWIPLWWWGATGWRLSFALLSFTPLVPVLALVVAVIAAATRRWTTATAAAVAVVVIGAVVLPRQIADGVPQEIAVPQATMTVATANLQFGRADPADVVALVRERRVTVLSLQELTPAAERGLAQAGLFAELPFRLTAPGEGARGTGLASRLPLDPIDVGLRPAAFEQVAVQVTVGDRPVEVLAVHPAAPFTRGSAPRWADEITSLPAPRDDGSPRALTGDFNATLDHRPFRERLATGYRDAAAEVGSGLVGTWPTTLSFPPFATIDHVLLAGTIRALAVDVRPVAGTDHAAVVAVLGLP